MSALVTYIATAAYAEVVDAPQVYETEVEARSEQEAEALVRDHCILDNGGDPADEDDRLTYELTDLFVRPKPLSLSPNAQALIAGLLYGEDSSRVFAPDEAWAEVRAAFPEKLTPPEWDGDGDAPAPVYTSEYA